MRSLVNYMSLHLKIKLQYKLSFVLTLIAQVLLVFVELYLITSLFEGFDLLEQFNKHELRLGFSVIWLGYSLAQTFGRGFDKFSNIIINGNFDLLLIRPQNIYLQIIGSDIFYEKFSRVIGMLIVYIDSSLKVIDTVGILELITLITMPIGVFFVIMGIFILGAYVCFFTTQGLEFVNIFTDGTKQLAQYPMSIYNNIIKIFFTFGIPITLVNYFPIEFLTGRSNNMLYVFLPIIASIFIVFPIMIFNRGIKKYKSTGS